MLEILPRIVCFFIFNKSDKKNDGSHSLYSHEPLHFSSAEANCDAITHRFKPYFDFSMTTFCLRSFRLPLIPAFTASIQPSDPSILSSFIVFAM